MKVAFLTLACLSLSHAHSASAASWKRCVNSLDGKPVIQGSRLLCDLNVDIDDLSNTGTVGQIFSRVTYTQSINLDVIEFVMAIGENHFKLGPQKAAVQAWNKEGHTITAEIHLDPAFTFSGLTICEMTNLQGELNITKIDTPELPLFVRNSLMRVANRNGKLKGIMTTVVKDFIPRVQEAWPCF